MSVRSAVLAIGKPAAATYTVLGTVPAGQTWILKSIVVLNRGAVADTVTVQGAHAGAIAANLLNAAVLAAGASVAQDSWLVLQPGDILAVYATAGVSDFWVSGTKLSGVAP
jgi:hypothetical protein